ncbi:MAG: trimethylamine methyltransferase family protein [Pseudomonadota bacterium]
MNARPRRRGRGAPPAVERKVNYRQLRNPFPPMDAVSADEAQAIHATSLHVLQELGIRVLLPEARTIFARAGARLDGDMVYLGSDIIANALKTAPRRVECRAGARDRDIVLEPGAMVFQPGAGAPHATDRIKGRRPGTAEDFTDLTRLTQAFDVLHMVPPLVEPQDVPTHIRHYFTMQTQLRLSDKLPFVFSRGTPQVADAFEILRRARGLSEDEFQSASHCYTIINTNSPRTLDVPMAQGLIDFARARQVSVVTPFTLMGAMAPITVAGGVMLSHAEALAAIALVQLTQPGAPVLYGTFTSNVDMKSGAPAFGTPEHFKASLLAGQMARLIDLPWRSAAGCAANVNDAQAANETQFGLWGCLLAGATVTIHAAGWMEGGLTVGYEKLITDLEVLQMVAEMCVPTEAGPAAIGLDALAEVQPGGHFFAAAQTMARYQTEFYSPLVADWSNFGTWQDAGARDATMRATDIWQAILAEPEPNHLTADQSGAVAAFIEKRRAEGGAPPES